MRAKISIEYDDTCEFCNEAVATLFNAMRTDDYPNRKVIVIRPDKNAFGHITHFHLTLTDDPEK